MDITLKGLPPAATEAWVTPGARGEPFRIQGEIPPGAAMIAVANQQVTIPGVPDGTEGQAFITDAADKLLEVRNFMAGFTRQIPRLDALVPAQMQSGSGRHLLQVQGRGLSMSNELYFGSAGQREPVRPLEQRIITTYIETDLWAPGQQPVWVVNAGTKSNVLMFEFTA
jgi:hypothetical protein